MQRSHVFIVRQRLFALWKYIYIYIYIYIYSMTEILCCVFKFYWLSDEGIKHLFNLYFN